jgi:hypothetical protein
VSFRIVSLYAFLAVGPDGEEGVMAERVNGTWIVFVAADETRLEQLRARVRQLAPPYTVKLVKFGPRVDVDTVHRGSGN